MSEALENFSLFGSINQGREDLKYNFMSAHARQSRVVGYKKT